MTTTDVAGDAPARVASVVPRLAARAAGHDDAAAFPADDVADLRDAGLLGLMVPPRLGGLGAGFADYAEVAMALGAASGATALLFNMHAAVTGALAGIDDELAEALGASPGFAAGRDEILAGAAAGRMYGVAISEAGAGSRLSRLSATTYEREGGGFRVRGRKVACSGAGHLDGYLLAAVPADGAPGVVSYFFLPPGPGVDAEGTWDPLGMRATASRGLRVDTVVPERHLLGGVEGLGLLLAHTMPQWLVASYAAVYVGVAEAAVDEAAAVLGEQQRRGRRVPAGARARLGRADAAVAGARAAVLEAARRVDAAPGDPATNRWVYRAKLLAGDAAMAAAADAAEACGLHALTRGGRLERTYRDARLGAVMPPRGDVCADVLGALALGLDPHTDLEDAPW